MSMNDDGFDPGDDRFAELKAGKTIATMEDIGMPTLLGGGKTGDRPMGAQRVAVSRRPPDEILAELKALGAAAGTDWYYRFPVKKKIRNEVTGRDEYMTDYIVGPSIKLANDLWRTYGNCDVDMLVVEDGRSWVFYARFYDIQSGASMTRPFQQRKSQEGMRAGDDRKRDIAFQIGASKAIRNVICNSLQTYADYAVEQAINSIVERFKKDLPFYRGKLVERCTERNWDVKRVERGLGRSVGEMLAPDLAKVQAMFKAIDDGMSSFDECFPAPLVTNPLGGSAEPTVNEHIATTLANLKQDAAERYDNPVAGVTQTKHDTRHISTGEARREPAGEFKASDGTQTAAQAQNAPAASARAPEGTQAEKTTDAKPIGEQYYNSALLVVEHATVAGSLNNWWKSERKARLEAGMTAAQLQALTDAYSAKFLKLSEA